MLTTLQDETLEELSKVDRRIRSSVERLYTDTKWESIYNGLTNRFGLL